jgi:DNA polymerase III epsilon subunit-like protein
LKYKPLATNIAGNVFPALLGNTPSKPSKIEVTRNAMPSTNSLKIEQTPIFIDFEASSLDLLSSYPIEVGICLPSGETRSWLIKPHVLWKDWSEKAARIHGISKSTLQEEGKEISEVIKELNAVVSGTVYCDAWAFDSFWMHRLFKSVNSIPNFKLDSITSILDSRQIDQWQDIRAGVIDESKLVRHRAANDALILHKTWKKIGASI